MKTRKLAHHNLFCDCQACTPRLFKNGALDLTDEKAIELMNKKIDEAAKKIVPST